MQEALRGLSTVISENSGKAGIYMFNLEKSRVSNVLEIGFDDWECIDPLGPFWDIIVGYSNETGLAPAVVDHFYNYKFTEDGYKIQFYWDAVSRIYVFYIASSQYKLISDRLYSICTDLNRRIAEMKYLKKYGELPNHGKGFTDNTKKRLHHS